MSEKNEIFFEIQNMNILHINTTFSYFAEYSKLLFSIYTSSEWIMHFLQYKYVK